MLAVEWGQGVEDAWGNVAEFVPKLVGFLLILIIGHFRGEAVEPSCGRRVGTPPFR